MDMCCESANKPKQKKKIASLKISNLTQKRMKKYERKNSFMLLFSFYFNVLFSNIFL